MQAQKTQTETAKKLEEIRARRMKLTNVYSGLEQTTEALRHSNATDTKGALQDQRSKLDKGLEEFNGYKTTIADLAVGLTDDLSTYVNVASSSQNYQGIREKVLSWLPGKFAERTANNLRVNRLRGQSPRENLKTIIDYSMQLYDEIVEVREGASQNFQLLVTNTDVIVTKIADYQPQEESIKAKLDAMEQAYNAKNDRYKTATPQEQAALVEEMNTEHKALILVRDEYDTVLTAYNQAQQALEANIQSRNSFEQMVRDLGRQATMIKEKMDNVTAIYESAPEAVKIMMTTKGMESLDKSLNAATDKSVAMIINAAGAVNDATLRREEIQLIDPDKMRTYMDRRAAMEADFQQRFAQIREQAMQSQEQRYSKN